MRPVSHTLIDSVSAPIDQVFALLTDPRRMIAWLPACDDVYVQSAGPLTKGARLVVRFGDRVTAFDVVDFDPPRTFGWVERGLRRGTKTFFRLDARGTGTAVTIREVWTPVTLPRVAPGTATAQARRAAPAGAHPRQLVDRARALRGRPRTGGGSFSRCCS
jgi:uncharacterized protein YndB with AHSA1/START domain